VIQFIHAVISDVISDVMIFRTSIATSAAASLVAAPCHTGHARMTYRNSDLLVLLKSRRRRTSQAAGDNTLLKTPAGDRPAHLYRTPPREV